MTRSTTKANQITWDLSCKEAFEELKNYLAKYPFLTNFLPRECLLIYMCLILDVGGSISMRQEATTEISSGMLS